MRRPAAAGFSLIEAVVATALVVSAIAALVALGAVASRQHLAARQLVTALALAQSVLDDLRAEPWTYAPDGSRVSSARLVSSPAGSLVADAPGYHDRVDRFGAVVTSGALFVRRWAVTPWQPSDPDVLLLQACVFRFEVPPPPRAEACVWTVRGRRP